MSKKTFFKTTALVAVLGSALLGGNAMGALPQDTTAIEVPAQTIQLTQEWDKIFPQSDKVDHRKVPSPEINTEDFSAAVDFLGSLDNVNRDEIGILGVCGWGGFALNAAVSDPRIKAVAVSTMYDITRVAANGYEIKMQTNADGSYDRAPAQSADARYKMKLDMSNARWETSKTVMLTCYQPTILIRKKISRRKPLNLLKNTPTSTVPNVATTLVA